MDEILLDHAHCEKRQPRQRSISSFAISIDLRSWCPCQSWLGKNSDTSSSYFGSWGAGAGLRPTGAFDLRLSACRVVRKTEPERFVDTMICCAFIEARSCERMRLLAEGLSDQVWPSSMQAYWRVKPDITRPISTWLRLRFPCQRSMRGLIRSRYTRRR